MVHGIDSMGLLKSSQKISPEKKGSGNDNPPVETESAAVAEGLKDTDKIAEQTASTNDVTEAAGAEKSSEGQTVCENATAEGVKDIDKRVEQTASTNHETEAAGAEKSSEGQTVCENATASDDNPEKVDEAVDAASPVDSETCRQTVGDADKNVDEDGVTEESKTEAKESAEKNGDVAMETDTVDEPPERHEQKTIEHDKQVDEDTAAEENKTEEEAAQNTTCDIAGVDEPPESCEQKTSDADKQVDEDAAAGENMTEAEEAAQKSCSDAMETDNVDESKLQNSGNPTAEGQDSSRSGEENKTRDDDDEPMETEAADNENSVANECSHSPQDDGTPSETQMETSANTADKDSEKSADKAEDAEATEEREKADVGDVNTENTAKESESQNTAAAAASEVGDGDSVEKKADDTPADTVEELDHSGDKMQEEQTPSRQYSLRGNVVTGCTVNKCA